MAWYQYEDARAKKAELKRAMARREKKGETFEMLVVPQGTHKLAMTFWGKAWCSHLETHADDENRLPRGRSYLRQGNVYNLVIGPGLITAEVAGSSLYEVRIVITPLAKPAWKSFKTACAGQVGSLLDLLGGKIGDGVLRAITDPDRGLFPHRRNISLSCSCPDWTDMCKHVAAVLYGVGVKLDSAPDLFFTLRSVDPSELLANAAQETLATACGIDAALADEDLSALFGIEIGGKAESGKRKAEGPEEKAKSGKRKAEGPKAKRKPSRKPVAAKTAKKKPAKPAKKT